MRNTLHLHIGSCKTGTTTIQKAFLKNKEYLKSKNILYPGSDVCHNPIFFISKAPESFWQREYKGIDKNQLSNRVVSYLNKIVDEISGFNGDVIISTEYLFSINQEKYAINVLDFFHKIFKEVIIYAFVRSPEEYYKSWQQQNITTRNYVESPVRFKYDFKNAIKSWEKSSNIKVIKYDKYVDSLKVMCKFIGVNYDELKISKCWQNQSMSIEQMVLLEKVQDMIYPNYNDILRGKVHLKQLPFIQVEGMKKPELQSWVKELVYHNHKEDLLWLKKQHGVDLINNNYTKPEDVMDKNNWSVLDVYVNPDKDKVRYYESFVVDVLLKMLANSVSNR